ncbi:hypothetical protein EJ07DRAFT_121554 [Lizonia empirigonia]|nr:hypothetical protein EJ07DRAFT_121554 [Lizonia empirigonia]
MPLFLLVCFAICFLVGPILSSTLAYLDIRNHFRAKAQVSEYDYRWEKITGIVVGTGSIGLGITGLVAIATAPHSTEMYSWLDALARLLQIFISPPWVIWVVHLVAVLTILDIVDYIGIRSCLIASRGKIVSSAYESALLACFVAASLLSSAISRKQLEAHKNSGSERRDEDYVRLLHTIAFTNTAAASFQLCGAIIVSSLSLAGTGPSTQLRQGIFMLLCHLPFYINRIWRRLIIPISDQIRRLRYSFFYRLTNGTF